MRNKKRLVVPAVGSLTGRLLAAEQPHQANIDGEQHPPADQEGGPEPGLTSHHRADSSGNKYQRKEQQADEEVLPRYLHATDCYTLSSPSGARKTAGQASDRLHSSGAAITSP